MRQGYYETKYFYTRPANWMADCPCMRFSQCFSFRFSLLVAVTSRKTWVFWGVFSNSISSDQFACGQDDYNREALRLSGKYVIESLSN